MLINRLLQSHFLKSSAIYSVANVLASLIVYLLNLLIARNFTLADYGEYTSALSYSIIFSVPLSAFGLIIIKRIGQADSANRASVAVSIEKWLERELIYFAPSVFGLSLILGFLMYFRGNMSIIAILFVILNTLLGIFSNFYNSVLQSYKNFIKVGAFSIISALSKLLLAGLVVILQPNLFWLFGAFLGSGLFSYILGKRMIRTKYQQASTNINFAKVKQYLAKKSVLIPLITTFGVVGLANTDIILVKKFFSSDQVGLYSSLSLLGKIILYLVAPLSTVAFTFFTGKESRHQSVQILAILSAFILSVGVSATTIYSLFPDLIINIIFGDKFLEVSNLVWMAAIFGSLYSLVNLYSQYYISINSKFAFLGLLAVVLQIIAIYNFHSTLEQILTINIFLNGGLVTIYIAGLISKRMYFSSSTR